METYQLWQHISYGTHPVREVDALLVELLDELDSHTDRHDRVKHDEDPRRLLPSRP